MTVSPVPESSLSRDNETDIEMSSPVLTIIPDPLKRATSKSLAKAVISEIERPGSPFKIESYLPKVTRTRVQVLVSACNVSKKAKHIALRFKLDLSTIDKNNSYKVWKDELCNLSAAKRIKILNRSMRRRSTVGSSLPTTSSALVSHRLHFKNRFPELLKLSQIKISILRLRYLTTILFSSTYWNLRRVKVMDACILLSSF